MRAYELHTILKRGLDEWKAANAPKPLSERHRNARASVGVLSTRDRSAYRFVSRMTCWCGAENIVVARVTVSDDGTLTVGRPLRQAHKSRRPDGGCS